MENSEEIILWSRKHLKIIQRWIKWINSIMTKKMRYNRPYLLTIDDKREVVTQCMNGTVAGGYQSWNLTSDTMCGSGGGPTYQKTCASGDNPGGWGCYAGGGEGQCVNGSTDSSSGTVFYGPNTCKGGSKATTEDKNSACFVGGDPSTQ
ncbi:MAG: hypothetical protein GY756_06940 [bacterium]|nr:hypothetical protein [bacterium]